MEYTLSKHAMDAMQARGIDPAWVGLTIDSPELTEPHRDDPSIVHVFRRIPQFGNRVLKVAYNKNKAPVHVVTVYFDRSAKGKL
jgi:hypothetical protein